MEQALTSFHLLAFGRARRRFQQFWRGRWDSVTRMKQVGGVGGRARWSHRFSERAGFLSGPYSVAVVQPHHGAAFPKAVSPTSWDHLAVVKSNQT